MRLKLLCIAVALFVGFVGTSYGQTTIINFDTAASWTNGGSGLTSYDTDHTYSSNNWLFTSSNGLRAGTTVQDGVASALGTYSWRLRDETCTFTGTYNAAGTITAFGFDSRRWDNDPVASWTVEYSINGGAGWTTAGTLTYSSSNWSTFSHTLASAATVTTGNFIVRITRSSGERIMIDNFSFTTAPTCTDPSLAFATSSYSKNVGDASFTQTATTNSAGAVTYASSNTSAATVNSSTGEVTIGTAGTATITATQVANGIYCADTATYTVVVTSTAPSITASGTLTALSTTYGTASANTTFSVSAVNLTNNLIITPPSSFEVSTSAGSGFATSLDLGTSNRTNTIIYVRLAATTPFGTYSGNITLASTGLTTVNVSTASSTVAKKTLTITGLTPSNKVYDGTSTATVTGTPTYSGLVSPDTFTVSGTVTWAFSSANVGATLTRTGTYNAPSSNYTVTQPTLTANLTAKALTISAATIASKVYDASAVSGTVTVGTLSGLIGTQTLGISATGAYADATVGTAKSATITYVLANGSNGGLAANYSLANGTGTGDITKANPVFSSSTIAVSVGGTYALPGSISSTSPGTLSYSITGGGYATLAGSTITGVSTGTETLTVNQAASTNYNAGSTTVSVSVSACSPPIWEENFDYGGCDIGDVISDSAEIMSNWNILSDGADPLKYNSTSLSYIGYQSSGIGGSIQYQGGGDDDIRRQISSTGVSSGAVYSSFLVNMTGAGVADYFLSFMDNTSPNPQFCGRVNMRSSGSGYQLGITKFTNGSVVWHTPVLSFNSTYLIVIKNEFFLGTNNDVLKMWIIPSGVPTSEALAGTPTLTAITADTDPVTSIRYIAIRQTGKENGFVDGIRVATNWESLFCGNTPTATTYTWTGTSSNSWANSGNWSPSGIPSSIDNIIINSAGTNTLNITDCRSVKDFTLNGTGTFAASATGVLTINGNITYGGTATATLDCASQIFIKSATPQPVPPLTYGNLDVLGGSRVFSPTGIIKICSAFNVDATLYTYTVTGSTVEYISSITGWEMSPFTYNDLIFSGTGAFSFGLSSPAANKDFTVLGNFLQSAGSVDLGQTASRTATLNIEGNMTISGGTFGVNRTSGSIGIVNLKGDLSVSNTAQLTGSFSGGSINFVGNGDGSTEALTQTIDIKNTNSVYYTAFSINNGFVKLANQDLYLGTNSSFEVKNGAIFSFGYAADNTTALNIVRVSSPTLRSGQTFSAINGSTLKLTSPLGITTSGTYTGNVQIGATSANRTFDAGATYHYIGKANQVSGNGLPSAIMGKVIVEMDTDALTFNASGNKTFNTGGTLEIRKGIVVDDSTNSFGDATSNDANLTMSGGRYKISKAGTQPAFSGTYNLAAGVVEYANSQTTAETVRTKFYQNIEITGNNVGNSGGNITLNDNGTFTVKNGGIFTINADAIVGTTIGTQTVTVENGGTFKTGDPDGFNGGAGLTATSVRSDVENINLNAGSTVEYSGADQRITLVPVTTTYSNLTVSGTGIKTIPTQLFLGNNLSVNASTLLIESNKTLIVTNKVFVDPAATMTIETNDSSQSGSLVQINDTDTNEGDITFNRTVPVIRSTDYTYWSSPVWGQDLKGFSIKTPTDMFYSFDATIFPENWKQETSSFSMGIGIGYCIYGEQISGFPPAFFNASFKGKPNNGLISVPIYFNGALDGTSNLIGNPYPSAIDADEFLYVNENVIEGTIYFWTHNTARQSRADIIASGATPGEGALAYTSNDYASYNSTGGTTGSGESAISDPNHLIGPDFGKIPNGKIASGQAFFTTSLLANGNVIFNNSMRLDKDSKVMDNSQFFKTRNPKSKTEAFDKHRIWLNLTNTKGVFKQTLIGYITDATNQYDTRFDGESFDGNEFADFYSINQEKNLVIQGRALPFDENDEVPLGFRTTINGYFTIKIDQADGVLTNQAVFLEDKLTNSTFDLRSGPYTFNTAAGTFNDRFVLRYTNKTLGTNDLETLENKVLVSNKNKQIKINSNTETIDKVVVYDLLGRLLFKKDKVNSNDFSILNLISNSETILVKVSLQNGETVTRKILY